MLKIRIIRILKKGLWILKMRRVVSISQEEIKEKIEISIRYLDKSGPAIMDEVVESFGVVDNEHNLRERIAGNMNGLCNSKNPRIERKEDGDFRLLV